MSAANQVSAVRQALANTLTQITKANGYSLDLSSSNIYKVYTTDFMTNTKDALYPKVFVVTDSGKNDGEPSYAVMRELRFIIILVLKGDSTGHVLGDPTTLLQDAITNFIDDVDRCLLKNQTLQGTVDQARVTDWTTDSGFTNPEGIGLLKVLTTRLTQEQF